MRIPVAILIGALALAPSAGEAQTAAPPTAAVAKDSIPQRVEPGLADRARRYARPTHEKIALLPAHLLRLPFKIVNYPLEHYLIHKEPGPVTVYAGRFVTKIGTHGVDVRLQGQGSGSGVGALVAYQFPGRWTASVPLRISGATTVRGYDQIAIGLDSLHIGTALGAVRLQYSERPQEDFFGLGPRSAKTDRTTYQQDEWLAQAQGSVRLASRLRLAADIGLTRHDIGRGRDADFPTVLQRFPASFAGVQGRFEFLDWGAGLVYDSRDVATYARHGEWLAARVQLTDGLGGTQNAYTKYSVEAQQFVALPGFRRSLAGRVRAVVTDNRGGSADVPLFRLERIGGSRSLRGYQGYRFTEHDALIGTLEYRFPIWSIEPASGVALDGVAFFDFGTAVPDLLDLQQRDLRSAAGIGIRVLSKRGLVFKIDNAWSPEGYRFHFGLRGTL